jgi:hypothetical protein
MNTTLTTPAAQFPARLGSKPRQRNLTQCARSSDMVELIGRHRVLTPQQIHGLLAPPGSKITNTYTMLRALRQEGLVDTGPRRLFSSGFWFATEDGMRLAYSNASRQRRGWVFNPYSAHGLLKHTWLANEIGRAFVETARVRGDECTWRSWDHEMTHGIDGGVLIADAVLSYVALNDNDVRALTYFVEVDRLTESYDQVLEQLRRYSRYATYAPIAQPGRPAPRGGGGPHWRNRYITFPTVLFVAGDELDPDHPNRERSEQLRVERVLALAARDRDISTHIQLLGTTFASIQRHGVNKAIWRTTNGTTLVSCLDGKARPTGTRSQPEPPTN